MSVRNNLGIANLALGQEEGPNDPMKFPPDQSDISFSQATEYIQYHHSYFLSLTYFFECKNKTLIRTKLFLPAYC